MKKTCIIWTIDKNELQRFLNESYTFKDLIVNKLGMKMDVPQGMHYKRLKKRIQEDCLDLTQFNINHKKYMDEKLRNRVESLFKKSNNELFIKNCNASRSNVKRRILQENIIPYKCSLCNLPPMWNDKEISLELDHINQINNDNRLENLRFLCPNCHSQVTNEHRKHSKNIKIKYDLCECGKDKTINSSVCRKCHVKKDHVNKRKFDPTINELKQIIIKYSNNICSVGKHYGVSDNSIRKRCRKLGIDWNSPGEI